MLELVLLAVIGVGLYRKRGERWEWSRARLRRAFRGLSSESDRAARRARRSLPDLIGQCRRDLIGLGDDLLGLLRPTARREIETRGRALARRGAVTGRALRPSGSLGPRIGEGEVR
ncbi:MAG: hypothetical protein MJB57_17735 [Gemmatimonadetes bacterium]|nr:hypothetical protein [Gemmatimonadota bacterium]